MLPVQRAKMLAQALRLGDTGCKVVFAFEGQADTLSPGWFHHSLPTLRFRRTHSMGSVVESSYYLRRLFINPEIR